MERTTCFIVTKREALHLLGIRKTSLAHLERAAKIADSPDRDGYTTVELKRLLAKLRRILGQ